MIYFIQCGHDGPIKIGHTNSDLGGRLSMLQVGCPWPLRVIGTMPGTMIEEAQLQRSFGHLHMRGEWYHPASQLLLFIEARSAPAPTAEIVEFEPAEINGEHWPDILAEVLRLRGWSQHQLARELGIQQPVVSRWMTGKCKPTQATKGVLRGMLATARAA